MKQAAMLVVCLFFFLGCADRISEEDLPNLNGYWEIAQVTFANGETKAFKVNTTIDFIALEGLKGYRKKMRPKLDGTFTTSDDAEVFVITETGNAFAFRYKNEMSEWTEKIESLSKDAFSVIDQDTITYVYKRFQPFDPK